MNSSLHPHWQDDEQPVEVHAKEPEPQASEESDAPQGVAISRRPAAIVGMVAVIGIGFTLFGGFDALEGQVAGSQNSIAITTRGFEPSSLTVAYGQTITWTNNQDIPHILESQTLCSNTGFCLQTKTLFNGDSDTFTITPDINPGTYEYYSSISENVRGTIVVQEEAEDEFDDFADLLEQEFDPQSPSPFGNFAAPPAAEPLPPAPVPNAVALPSNPYTVGSTKIHPFDSSGEPIPEAFGDDPNEERRQDIAQRSMRRTGPPPTQPETGAPVLIGVFLLAVAAMWATSKKMLNAEIVRM